jgi:hypothetical protein
MHDHGARNIHDLGDRDEVLQRTVRELGVVVRVDRHRADVAEQETVAVGAGPDRDFHADVAGGAGPVVHHHLLLEELGHRRLDDAADGVRSPARSERHDHAYRPGRVFVLLRLCECL